MTPTRRVGGVVLTRLLDLLYPPRCVGCGREGPYLCPACLAGAVRLTAPASGRTKALEGIVAPFAMEGVAREAVHRLKYSHLRAAAPEMGKLLGGYLEEGGVAADVLVPVPLHRKRHRERGYNQAELLAREVGRCLGVEVRAGGLRRISHGSPQARAASRDERQANVAGAFEAQGSFEGLDVLVLDDVTTTGATLEACGAALGAAGAASVWGAAFAHEV